MNYDLASRYPHRNRPRARRARADIRHALFDFDGTLSLIREGWQQVMIPADGRDAPGDTPRHEPRGRAAETIVSAVHRPHYRHPDHLPDDGAGGPGARDGAPCRSTPSEYKRIYLERLWQHIANRVNGLGEGTLKRRGLPTSRFRGTAPELKQHGNLLPGQRHRCEYVRDEAGAAPGRLL